VQHLTLFGRSSSHFTRVARVFAAEAGADYEFRIVPDLTSVEPRDYGGNPALKIPSLCTPDGDWYGALAISRELVRRSGRPWRGAWPEDFVTPLLSNAQELVLHAMATEVSLIMNKAEAPDKRTRSLLDTLTWLEAHAPLALATLPSGRDPSFLEVTLYCLVRHLEFRKILPTTPYVRLSEFCRGFDARDSIRTTEFRFDA